MAENSWQDMGAGAGTWWRQRCDDGNVGIVSDRPCGRPARFAVAAFFCAGARAGPTRPPCYAPCGLSQYGVPLEMKIGIENNDANNKRINRRK